MSCGTLYTKVYNDKYFYSTLTHSVAVALIIWYFTQDKKQTISGLFHDIATPTFKHCIDFMNRDSEHQESTEERTEQIIRDSKEIMKLLERDNIKVEEVSDYHIYPIADNDTPRLSADRFEYTLSGGLYQVKVFELKDIEKYYNNIIIAKNEDGIDELSFQDIKLCENFINDISKLWPRWVEDEDRLCMQFIADIVKSMNTKNYITVDDLYKFSEQDILQLIQNCEDSYIKNAFMNFQNATRDSVYKSDIPNNEIYCTSVKGKKRYINPLVCLDDKINRIKDASKLANDDIDNFLNMKLHKYIGFNFDFKPYNKC
ncbi:MAG: HD domain-containing protein [Clostridia bacterium]|nr:HD domain-containing protein [Clostridia bacterium]